MAEETTAEAPLQQNCEQAAQVALRITQNKLPTEVNARHKKRLEQLKRQVKRPVTPEKRAA